MQNALWAGSCRGQSERTSLRVLVTGRGIPGRESGSARDRAERSTQQPGEGASVPHPQLSRSLRRPSQGIADDIIGAVGCILQRAFREVSIPLGWVQMTQYLLDFIERLSAVHQKRRIRMA